MQRGTASCSTLQCVAAFASVISYQKRPSPCVLQRVAVCCSELLHILGCCSTCVGYVLIVRGGYRSLLSGDAGLFEWDSVLFLVF